MLFPFCIFLICRFSCYIQIFPPFSHLCYNILPFPCIPCFIPKFFFSHLPSAVPELDLHLFLLTEFGGKAMLFFFFFFSPRKTLFSSPVGWKKDQANLFSILLHEGLLPYVVWVWWAQIARWCFHCMGHREGMYLSFPPLHRALPQCQDDENHCTRGMKPSGGRGE